jgi:hypothetical protein
MVCVRPCDPENEEIERPSSCPLLPPVWSRQSMGTRPGITAKGPIDTCSQHSKRHVTYKLFEKNMLRTNSITYGVQIPGMKTYFTLDPTNIKAILATQFQDFGKGPLFYESWKEVTPSMWFTNFSSSVMVYSLSTEHNGRHVVLYYGLSSSSNEYQTYKHSKRIPTK